MSNEYMAKSDLKSLNSIPKFPNISFDENFPISSIKKVPENQNSDPANPKTNPIPKKSTLDQLIKSSQNQNFTENPKLHSRSDPQNNKNDENDGDPPKTTELEHTTNFIERSEVDGGSFTYEEPEDDPDLKRRFNEAETKLRRKAVQIIEAYEKEKKYIKAGGSASYCILEDLVIWKSFPNERNDVWKKLGENMFLTNRSLNSIRDRYRFYLQNLDKKNYLEILDFLEKLPNLDLRNYCLLFKNNTFQRITELQRGKAEKNNAKYRFNASHIIEKKEGVKFDNDDDDQFDFGWERLLVNKEETKNMRNDGKFEERKGVENATNKPKNNIYSKPVLKKGMGDNLHDGNQGDEQKMGFKKPEENSHSVFRKQIVQKAEKNDAKSKSAENSAFKQDLQNHHDLSNKKDLQPVNLSLVSAEIPSNLEKAQDNKEKKGTSALKRKESPAALTKNDGSSGLKHPENDKTATSEQTVEIPKKWCNCPHLPEIYSNSILENVSEKLKLLEKDQVLEEVNFFNMVIILSENANEKKIIKTRQNLIGNNAMSKINELSISHKKSVEELLKILDSLNGNIEELEIFLTGEMKNKSMVWHEEEDNLLRSLVSKSCLEFRILQRYKEIERIKTRSKFLNLQLPFEL